MTSSVVDKLQAELDKLYDWLDNPEQNTVGRTKIYKPLSYQEQYFGYEDNEPEAVCAVYSYRPEYFGYGRPKPNKPPKTSMFEEGRKFRV